MSECPALPIPVKTDIRMYFSCGCMAVRFHESHKDPDPKWYIFPWGGKKCALSVLHREEVEAGAQEAWEKLNKKRKLSNA